MFYVVVAALVSCSHPKYNMSNMCKYRPFRERHCLRHVRNPGSGTVGGGEQPEQLVHIDDYGIRSFDDQRLHGDPAAIPILRPCGGVRKSGQRQIGAHGASNLDIYIGIPIYSFSRTVSSDPYSIITFG